MHWNTGRPGSPGFAKESQMNASFFKRLLGAVNLVTAFGVGATKCK